MSIEDRIKAFIAVVGLAGFLFGVYEFVQTRAIEAGRPYLEKKLLWCEEAVEVASRIAVADQPADADIARFWEMYYGVMGLIEKQTITTAMIDFGAELRGQIEASQSQKGGDPGAFELGPASLTLAHACRAELAAEWSTRWSR